MIDDRGNELLVVQSLEVRDTGDEQIYEVPQPILNSPFDEPAEHWHIVEGEAPGAASRAGARPIYFYRDPKANRTPRAKPSRRRSRSNLPLVNLIRERVEGWRAEGYPGVTRTTLELLQWWRREGRERSGSSSPSSKRPRRSSS